MKTFLRTKVWYLFLTGVCSLIGARALYIHLFNMPYPVTITAEGVELDKSSTYKLTNEDKPLPNEVNLGFTDNYVDHFYPSKLGQLYYDGDQWAFFTSDQVQNLRTEHHPFKAFLRDSEIRFYKGEIGQALINQGLVFNIPGGTKRHRYYLRTFNYNNREYLSWSVEGLKKKYTLAKQDTVSVNFGKAQNSVDYKCYNFKQIAKNGSSNYRIITQQRRWFKKPCYTILEGDEVIAKGEDGMFTIENILFRIGNKYSSITHLLLCLHYLFLVVYLVISYQRLFNGRTLCIIGKVQLKNPLQNSIQWVSALCFMLALIGIPIAINYIGFGLREGWDQALPFFCIHSLFFMRYIVYFLTRKSTYKWKKRIKRGSSLTPRQQTIAKVVFPFFVIASWFVFGIYSENESILDIPVLHAAKFTVIIVLFLSYITNLNYYLHRKKEGLIKRAELAYTSNQKHRAKLLTIGSEIAHYNSVVIFYTIVLSILTQDYSILMYTTLALFFVSSIRNIKCIWKYISVLLVVFLGVIIVSRLLPDNELTAKLYRFTCSIFTPDNNIFSSCFGHRETVSELFANLRLIVDTPFGFGADYNFLRHSQSVAGTDYAAHSSIVLDGLFFLIPFLLVQFSLVYHLLYILFLSIKPICISSDDIDNVFSIRESHFWSSILPYTIAISLVQLILPFLSSLLVPGSILSGVPLTFISIGKIDTLFFVLLLTVVEILFHYKDLRISIERNIKTFETPFTLGQRSFRYASVCSIVIIGGIILSLYLRSNQLDFERPILFDETTEDELIIPSECSQKQIKALADSIVLNVDGITEIPPKEKQKLLCLASLYYTDKSFPVYKTQYCLDLKEYRKTISKLSRNLPSSFKLSGGKKPFGEVYKTSKIINGKKTWNYSNEFYSNVSHTMSSNDRDLTAILNKELQNWCLNISTELEGQIIIDKINGKISSKHPLTETSSEEVLIGSTKKILLYYAGIKADDTLLDFKHNGVTLSSAIRWSNSKYANAFLARVCSDKRTFKLFCRVLDDEFNLSLEQYSGCKSREELLDLAHTRFKSVAIGGTVYHSLNDVISWYEHIFNSLKSDKELLEVFHQSFQGTSEIATKALQKAKIDVENSICKTGTLEAKGRNIISAYVFTNENVTIVIHLKGVQPDNREEKTAKYLFASIVPTLKDYKVLK